MSVPTRVQKRVQTLISIAGARQYLIPRGATFKGEESRARAARPSRPENAPACSVLHISKLSILVQVQDNHHFMAETEFVRFDHKRSVFGTAMSHILPLEPAEPVSGQNPGRITNQELISSKYDLQGAYPGRFED